MSATLRRARLARPKARWGYYGFPNCFNFTPNNNRMTCEKETVNDNDRSMRWMSESGAIYPSVYLRAKDLSEGKRAKLIQGRTQEALRVAGSIPVFPFATFKYTDTREFYSKADFKSSLQVPKRLGAAGVVIWGASKDVNGKEACREVEDYVTRVIAPLAKSAVAPGRRDSASSLEELDNEISAPS